VTKWKKDLVKKSKWVIVDCANNRVVAWFDDPDDMAEYFSKMRANKPYNTYKVATLG
jgi:hypothetical protein